MDKLKKYVTEQISKMIANFEKIEFSAFISDKSYSVEFFVTIDGKRMQNYNMIDAGILKESDFDDFSRSFTEYVRSSPEFIKGKVNNYKFDV